MTLVAHFQNELFIGTFGEPALMVAAIQQQLETGGYEALLYDLLNEDLENFNPRRFPHSNEAFNIKMLSANTIDKYVYSALQDGCFDVGNGSPDEIWRECISKDSVFVDYCAWCCRNGVPHAEKDPFSKRLRKLISSIGDTRPSEGGKRINKYLLPTLDKARSEFEQAYKADGTIWQA
jgi:hypothetical protein